MSNKKTMTNQLESILDDIIQGEEVEDKQIYIIDEETIQISKQEYRLIKNYREGFEQEAFTNRYQPFFEKFDFIVGDWGHDLLRLRGFYQLGRRKVPRDQQIDFLDDYIKEYCNFGAAYFVLGKVEAVEKYHQLEKRETIQKNVSRQPKNQRPKTPHVTTTTDKEKAEDTNFKPKNIRRKKAFKKNQTKGEINKPKKVTEKVSEKVANDKKFVIKKVTTKE
ncbi:YutD family protein [Ruoffia sp. FAM 24228]|uniref:YutD family protein n=1 Tax=unclassified Ruoffia TaxID=2862149 RepID=UPI00388AF79F